MTYAYRSPAAHNLCSLSFRTFLNVLDLQNLSLLFDTRPRFPQLLPSPWSTQGSGSSAILL